MNQDKVRQAVNLLGVVAVLVVNGLANALPINGKTTGEVSDRFDVYFVPAGYVFSIWVLIYVGLIAFSLYQALPAQRENPRLRSIGYLFGLSCAANVAWLFLWHHEAFELTVVAMLGLLLSLIAIYLRLDVGRVRVSRLETWCVDVPFSVYLGWVSVATIANVTSLLDYWNWDGWGLSPEAWAVIMLLVGVGLASAVGLTRGDAAYLLVFVWAYVGIAVRHAETATVASVAWLATALIAVMLGVSLWVKRGRSTATG